MSRFSRLTGALAALLAVAVALMTLSGCGKDDEKPSVKETGARHAVADRLEPLAGKPPEPRLPVTVRSADGRDVTVRSADRIVPLSGSVSEIVFSLGLGDRVVARDISATFAEASKLPVVTRAHDVSAESVLSLKPGVVLADTRTGPGEALDQIRAAGVPVVVLDVPAQLSDVGPHIERIAAALGVRDAGAALRKRSEERLERAKRDIPRGGRDKPRVAFLYMRGSASVYLLGGARSGASSLIEAAGGVDAGKESGLTKDFTPITTEALAKAAPDVILVMSKGLESVGGVDGLLKIPGVAETPAGLDRRVASVDDGVLLNYGPRTDAVLRSLVEQIHRGGGR
ncbi:ABC transporter substrate-binding protein [Streptomyces sp. AV19]|uniref:heme/hemin ABC transporter substrate-binding protein n=1 Tax=Streptomyces sp. AV19 TaxID=2793068 RepID=UPI0018FE861A|nr:ABC transporter substrate-binding protein [Streptomyces sp. AV19]MBH1933439.1 ABC transporter substrate-binding protein [Streptomyces sp. AV19]MDG4532088.1 ABC transporter substrate-binding protein [Streptomyces sp. AV19]